MKFIKRSILHIALCAAVCLSAVPVTAAADSYTEQCERVLELVNSYRAENGAEPLILYAPACSAAQTRAEEIEQVFSHKRPDGSDFYTALTETGISISKCGENIAYGYDSADEVVSDWMKSDGHRANILNPDYKYLGVGVSNGNWTQEICDIFESTSGILGDVNNDGNVNAVDSSLVLEFYAYHAISPFFEQTRGFMTAADVNTNGVIDAIDASEILKYYAESSTGKNASFE